MRILIFEVCCYLAAIICTLLYLGLRRAGKDGRRHLLVLAVLFVLCGVGIWFIPA